MSAAQRKDEYDGHDQERGRDGDQTRDDAHTAGYRSQGRQVRRHRQVLDHEQADDGTCLGVVAPAKIAHDLRHDPRGRDVGDATECHRAKQSPAEEQACDRTGGGVQHEVEQACRLLAADGLEELTCGVFEAEEEQE